MTVWDKIYALDTKNNDDNNTERSVSDSDNAAMSSDGQTMDGELNDLPSPTPHEHVQSLPFFESQSNAIYFISLDCSLNS